MEILNQYSGIIALVVLVSVLCFLLRRNNTKEEVEEIEENKTTIEKENCPLDERDEDALIACLVASIDAREQTNKNVQIISVRRIG